MGRQSIRNATDLNMEFNKRLRRDIKWQLGCIK
jgi:hypothetical protein